MSRSMIPVATATVGDCLSGFEVTAVTPLDDIKALCYEARHVETGAELMHIHCNDEENMFCVGFCTPPSDSTGVPHILEHSVLAGSQKYPVKDAFNELGKRTLNTFLNAMTWPDRTIYPTCSTVRADYFNLASVYLDLVFSPLLKEETFKQEGHHLTFDDLERLSSALRISGVVYNEMKGVYSSPEAIAEREMLHALFPDTTYGVDSGGDPDVIPRLTYKQFKEFHRRFYSPSNARFLLYGDVPLAENLGFLQKYLARFQRIDVDASIALQPRWQSPRELMVEYPVGGEDALSNKSFVTLSWMVSETADVMTGILLEVLLDALTGSAAGPVRKALVDSGLGQTTFPDSALETDLRQSMVSFGLRETDASHADQIESIIVKTLERLASEGIDPALIEASFHQIEFAGKEIVPPFPIMLMMRVNRLWYYGADPKDGLRFSSLVEQARRRYESEPAVFEDLIRTWFLYNPHRLRLVLTPSNTLAATQAEAFDERMSMMKARLSTAELEQIQTQAVALMASQQAPDDPAAIQALPMLSVRDIPRPVTMIVTEEREVGGVRLFEHPTFSNGVVYLGLSFDLRGIDDQLLSYVPLMAKATLGMGAAGLTYDKMAVRIAQSTGGISYSATTGKRLGSGDVFSQLAFDGKALSRNTGALVGVLRDLLTAADMSDFHRLRDLVRERVSNIQSSLIPSGHRFAYLRAAARLGKHFYQRELWQGASQLKFLKQLAHRLDDDTAIASLASTLATLQQRVFTRERLLLSVAGDGEALAAFAPGLAELVGALPSRPRAALEPESWLTSLEDSGVVIPAQVNYVGQVMALPDMTGEAAADYEMLAQVLSSDFCYKKIRVQGGAYGGFCFYTAEEGVMGLLSYRDPNLESTYKTFGEIVDYARSGALNDEAIEASRIGAIGSISRPLAPEQIYRVARNRHFYGIDDALRQRFRDGLFDVSAARIAERTLETVASALASAPRAALASRERLTAYNASHDRPLKLFLIDD